MNKFTHTTISLTLASVFSLAMISACGKTSDEISGTAPADTAASTTPAPAASNTSPLTPDEARKIAEDGFVYGLSLIHI